MPAIDTAELEIASLQGDRDYQQDAAYWTRQDGHLVAAVADGMGSGKGSGGIAGLAVDLATRIASAYGPDNPQKAIAATGECVRVLTAGDRGRNDDTTLVLATVDPAGTVRVAWVGDSRCYVLTRGGRLRQLTKDHNRGPWAPNVLTRALLGPDLHHLHDGAQECEWHTPEYAEWSGSADPAVMVVLVTDGVCGPLGDEEIRHVLETAPNPRRAARRLTGNAVRAAEENCADNATALVIDLSRGA